MDKLRQKSKKEKPIKHVQKDQSNLFITDVKAIKENLKIKEILRTVKMNSSMRIKAPKGSKVMQNKDFNDNEDMFGGEQNIEEQNISELPSATNADVIVNNNNVQINDNITEDVQNKFKSIDNITMDSNGGLINDENISVDTSIHVSVSVPEGLSDFVLISDEDKQNNPGITDVKINLPPSTESSLTKARDRKLSLDQTMLSRRGGLSQSELDLNLIGKSPLERKSSFFRKKMDSFLKNTTEIFKRQSISRSQSIQRKGSMSVSLQSLNKNTACNGDYGGPLHDHQEEIHGSVTSLQSSLTPARSGSSLSISQSERTLPDPQSEGNSLAGSRPVLTGSQPLGDSSSHSIHSLSEAYIQEASLNRAISMSSGLDSANGRNRRKFRANRVTWLASEGLTNHIRRLIQDETCREMNVSHSYQDFSTIPENNLSGLKTDSKGRRLSYQRAVSGEDSRHQETSIKRKQLIPENTESTAELPELLAGFTLNGVPDLKGFDRTDIPEEAFRILEIADKPDELQIYAQAPKSVEQRQGVIKELISTEAAYIRHMRSLVEVFIAAAHSLQDSGKLLDIDTERLFSNIPDIVNANLYFWGTALYPMIADALEKQTPFNTEFMAPGFMNFGEIFHPYEKYLSQQTKALDYLRSLNSNIDFLCYLTWCHSHKSCNRLQLSDILVKPMQRLTKYSLLLRRLIIQTDAEPDRSSLIAMESSVRHYVQNLNRSIRYREEIEKMNNLYYCIEAYELEFKDDELDKLFRRHSLLDLKSPMLNCAPYHLRTLIHRGDVRYKDNMKEMEVHAFLFTDILLICKKLSKGSPHTYKLVRPKVFIYKLHALSKPSPRNPKETGSIAFVALDDLRNSLFGFIFFELSKDSPGTMKVWENKLREAKLTYELALFYTQNPNRDLSEMDMDSSSEYAIQDLSKQVAGVVKPDDVNIERDARERVAAMLHFSMGGSTDCEYSQVSTNTESLDGEPSTSGGRAPALRHHNKRYSAEGSSRNSRLSSFQQSTSATSHDEPQPGPSHEYRAGTSVEHVIPPLNPEDGVTSITVNVVSESEPKTVARPPLPTLPPPSLILEEPSPVRTPQLSRSSSSNRNTLRVHPHNVVVALVHSLPDLSFSPLVQRVQPSPGPQTASEKMYQSHQELLQRNRLTAQQQQRQRYLTPDHRGISYPPPTATRASLKRGLAFSYSFKNPPLSKMGHVNSQSQQAEAVPPTSQGVKGENNPTSGITAENRFLSGQEVQKHWPQEQGWFFEPGVPEGGQERLKSEVAPLVGLSKAQKTTLSMGL